MIVCALQRKAFPNVQRFSKSWCEEENTGLQGADRRMRYEVKLFREGTRQKEKTFQSETR